MDERLRGGLRSDLARLAIEVGATLNIVQDDDDREKLQEHFEQVLNRELHAGALNRATAAPVIDLMERLQMRAKVVELFPQSRRVPR